MIPEAMVAGADPVPDGDARPMVEVTCMTVDAGDEAAAARWLPALDAGERQRADRIASARQRVTYVAAHALTRHALSRAAGGDPRSWRFATGEHGKPVALAGDLAGGPAFNLTHTDGLVAVAVSGVPAVGIDAEAADRSVDLKVADRYFTAEEIAWLESLAPADRPQGFLRLWTLKEAFIKATGLGLSQGLDKFWFDVYPPAIRFTPSIEDDPAAWRFEQQLVAGRFLVAVGVEARGTAPTIRWRRMEPRELAL